MLNTSTTDATASSDPMDFTVRPLGVEDAPALSSLLRSQRPEYARFFTAFAFDADEIARMLAGRGRDVYMGLLIAGELAACFMIRGWNEGYDVPAFGSFVAEKYRGRGLMQLTVEMMKVISRLRGAKRVMYKSHPDNAPAQKAAAMGFIQDGVDPVTGNLIFYFDV
jgi:RimJ/RimL family protein N-acetyltransferase